MCNGLNVKDIARLQYKNINGNKITFIRAKTEKTAKQDQKIISVPINDEIRQIIKKWGIESKNPNEYVFGIINNDDSTEQQFHKIKYATKKNQ